MKRIHRTPTPKSVMLHPPMWLTLSFTLSLNNLLPTYPNVDYIAFIDHRTLSKRLRKLERQIARGQYDKALQLAEALHQEFHTTLPPEHPEILSLEYSLSTLYYVFEDYDRSIDLLSALYKKYRVIDSEKALEILHQLSNVYFENNDYHMALEHYEQTYESYLKVNDPLDPTVLSVLGAIGYVQSRVGMIDESIDTLKYVLKHQIESAPNDHQSISLTRSDLINVYQTMGLYQNAHKLLMKQLTSDLHFLGPNDPDTLYTRYQIAKNFYYRGDIRTSKSQYFDLLELQTSIFGEDDWRPLRTLNDLSIIYAESGDLIEAERVMHRIIEQRSEIFGLDHSSVWNAQHNLASIYIDLKRYKQAQELLMVIIDNPSIPQEDIILAKSTLASSYNDEGKPFEALKLREEVLVFRQSSLGTRHPTTILSLNNIAGSYNDIGDLDRAEELYLSILKYNQEDLGAYHPRTLDTMNNLATLYKAKGDLQQAESLLLQALDGMTEVLPNEDPRHITVMINLASLYQISKDYEKSFHYIQQSTSLSGNFLSKNLFGSEIEKQTFLMNNSEHNEFLYGLFFEHLLDNSKALEFTLNTWLNSKGLLFKSSNQTLQYIRQHNDDEAKQWQSRLDGLQQEQTRLLQSQSHGTNSERLSAIDSQIEQLEKNLSLKTRSINDSSSNINASDIIGKLPKNALLFDFIVYHPIDDTHPYLGLFVVEPTGTITPYTLGSLDTLQKQLMAFRQTRNPSLGALLYDVMFTQNEIDVPSDKHIIFSTDGILSTIPLELLQDDNGEMLIERGPVSYLSTSRDLVDFTTQTVSLGDSPIVLANPTFNPRDSLSPLPNTQKEADLLKGVYRNTTTFIGSDATTHNLKNIDNPSLLHLATHGFYQKGTSNLNPMTQSGLELAYVPTSVGESSRILASEMTSLRLTDTKLVVLSACESGLGTSLDGEGVYGLRRALRLAGAQSLLISLWPVNDDATAVFMEGFYSAVNEGLSLEEAVRTTKMSMKHSDQWSNPVNWAAFILVGNWK